MATINKTKTSKTSKAKTKAKASQTSKTKTKTKAKASKASTEEDSINKKLHCTKELLEHYRIINYAIDKEERKLVGLEQKLDVTMNADYSKLTAKQATLKFERSLLDELVSAVDDLATVKNGRNYQRLIHLKYIDGKEHITDKQAVETLLDLGVVGCKRTYDYYKKDAINVLGNILWLGMTDEKMAELSELLHSLMQKGL